jgi:hypothetical protein
MTGGGGTLNSKATECEFDRESGVGRLRIQETEHLDGGRA